MDERQTMHAMMLDDAYCVERVLADGAYGVTEMVSLDGVGPFVRKKMPLRLARRRLWSPHSPNALRRGCRASRRPTSAKNSNNGRRQIYGRDR